MEALRAPRFDAPIDLESHLRLLPPKAVLKGFFVADVLAKAHRAAPAVDLAAVAGVTARRYTAFLDYPYADYLRLLVAAARVVYPHVSVGEGLRRFGQDVYPLLLGNHIGRVLFGVLGLDAERVLLQGPRGYQVTVNFAAVTAERLGDRAVRYRYRNMPVFLETLQVGVLEGALAFCRVEGRILVALDGLASGVIDIRW